MKKLLVLFSLTTSQLFAASVGYWQIPLNLNASQLTSGTVPTNVLPGALPTLSTWNGGGVLTNAASPAHYFYTNWTSSAMSSNLTVPSWARVCVVECMGAGGPGGSGGRAAAGTARTGGGGGAGGSYAMRIFRTETLWTPTLVITIPALPTGGAGPTTDNSPGTNGTAAAASTIVYVGSAVASNYVCRAVFGAAGGAGSASGSAGSAGAAATTGGDSPGTAGGASSATGGVGVAGAAATSKGSRGGGSGGGITTADVPNAGGGGMSGGVHAAFNTTGGSVNGAAVQTFASLTTVPNPYYITGLSGFSGAAGSGGATNVASANGGDGEFPGSGGGGSGATLNGSTPGRGGNGGPGAVAITFY